MDYDTFATINETKERMKEIEKKTNSLLKQGISIVVLFPFYHLFPSCSHALFSEYTIYQLKNLETTKKSFPFRWRFSIHGRHFGFFFPK